MDIYSPKTIAEVLDKYSLSPLKKLGQNFLCDENVVEKIAAEAVSEECVLEIGPGLGVLTRSLAKRAKKVVAVEIDAGMVRALEYTLQDIDNVEVIHMDILKADIFEIYKEKFGQPFCVAGNLPYYITSKCIMQVLESGAPVTQYTAMVQREVADRLAAQPGDADYGALTASVNYFGGARKLFDVSRMCFYPRPEVDSAVIAISPTNSTDVNREHYAAVVRALFAMRRKTVLNNLQKGLKLSRTEADRVLLELGISPMERAENLSMEQFAMIARAVFDKSDK